MLVMAKPAMTILCVLLACTAVFTVLCAVAVIVLCFRVGALEDELRSPGRPAPRSEAAAMIWPDIRIEEAALPAVPSPAAVSSSAGEMTVFDVPAGLTDTAILQKVAEQGVMLAGCFDTLAGRVIRIGHMGENANIEDMRLTMRALHNALTALGKPPCCNLDAAFLHALEA